MNVDANEIVAAAKEPISILANELPVAVCLLICLGLFILIHYICIKNIRAIYEKSLEEVRLAYESAHSSDSPIHTSSTNKNRKKS